MSVLKLKNTATGIWEDIQTIIGPRGLKGDKGDPGDPPTEEEIRAVFQEDLDSLEDEISEKMSRYVMRLVKNADSTYKLTSLDDVDLSFTEVRDITQDLSKYVVVLYGNSKLRPQYVSTNEMIFIGLDRSTESKILRMHYTPDRLAYDAYVLAEKTDLTGKADKSEVEAVQADVAQLNEDIVALENGKVGYEDWAVNTRGGVVRLSSTFGIDDVGYWNTGDRAKSNGYLRIIPAQAGDINNRASPCPIAPPNLDYAVKAALTDGKGAAYTDAEKKAARERIGASGGTYELIETINANGSFKSLTRRAEPDGTPYNFIRLIVEISCPIGSGEISCITTLPISSPYERNSYIGIATLSASYATITKMQVECVHGILNTMPAFTGRNSSGYTATQKLTTPINEVFLCDAITNLTFSSGTNIPDGTTIKIYAVRA